MYEERFYRDFVKSKFSLEVSYKESDLFISSDKELDKEFVYNVLRRYYIEIEDYIRKNPVFLTSLSFLSFDENAPQIVKDMLVVSKETNIGPFSSVAGAIAKYVGRDLLNYTDELIIENGGDIFLKINEDKKVGVYLGERFSYQLKDNFLILKIKKRDQPFGIASSSAYIGESLNFGKADLLTVIAKDSIIADGFATALSNLIKEKKDIEKVVSIAKKNSNIYALIIAFESKIYLWGEIEIAPNFCDNKNV